MGLWIALLIALLVSPAGAMGRKSDDRDDYPDYNRIEFHRKPPETAAPQVSTTTEISPGPVPVIPPPKAPIEPEAAPKPAPTAVPLPADDSEPVLPDDMMKTLTPSTTTQK